MSRGCLVVVLSARLFLTPNYYHERARSFAPESGLILASASLSPLPENTALKDPGSPCLASRSGWRRRSTRTLVSGFRAPPLNAFDRRGHL